MGFSVDRFFGPLRRKVACAGFLGALVALVALCPGRADAQTANPPPNWLAELPSAEKVKAFEVQAKEEVAP